MGVSMSVSIRLGTCLALVILAPILCSTSQGIALSALIGAALMLSTRSIRSRVEVLIGVLSGMAVLAWAAYAAALQSATSLLLVLVTSLTGSLLVLATNVVTPKTAPGSRARRHDQHARHHRRAALRSVHVGNVNGIQ